MLLHSQHVCSQDGPAVLGARLKVKIRHHLKGSECSGLRMAALVRTSCHTIFFQATHNSVFLIGKHFFLRSFQLSVRSTISNDVLEYALAELNNIKKKSLKLFVCMFFFGFPLFSSLSMHTRYVCPWMQTAVSV